MQRKYAQCCILKKRNASLQIIIPYCYWCLIKIVGLNGVLAMREFKSIECLRNNKNSYINEIASISSNQLETN